MIESIFFAVDRHGEAAYKKMPIRDLYWTEWEIKTIEGGSYINLPEGSIEQILGRKLTWDDDPVEWGPNLQEGLVAEGSLNSLFKAHEKKGG